MNNSSSYATGYKAWGEQRFVLPSGAASPTSFGYNARWYDSIFAP